MTEKDFEKFSEKFLNLIREKNKDYINSLTQECELSQECEGTFKIKDGNITYIKLTGIALMPRFRGKNK